MLRADCCSRLRVGSGMPINRTEHSLIKQSHQDGRRNPMLPVDPPAQSTAGRAGAKANAGTDGKAGKGWMPRGGCEKGGEGGKSGRRMLLQSLLHPVSKTGVEGDSEGGACLHTKLEVQGVGIWGT